MTKDNLTAIEWNADKAVTCDTSYATAYDSLTTVDTSMYIADCVAIKADGRAYAHQSVNKEEAPAGATNLLVTKDKRIKVKNCKDGFVETTKDIMSNIKEIAVKADGINSTVIFVTFADGKTEKAVLDPEDEFSLEHGLTIIMLEKLLSDKGVDGKSVHNKLVKYAMKFYKRQEETKTKEQKQQKEEKERVKRIKEKIKARKAKKSHDEKEYQIEIQKEAYLRAMRELAKESE